VRLALAACVLLAAGCGEAPAPTSAGDASCAGDPTRPISAATLTRVLARHDITVRADYDGVICGGFIGSPEEEMPVKLGNDSDEGAMEREGAVFCGLRRGPIWGPKLESNLDAPPASPIFSGTKAEFKVANLECTIYPEEGPRAAEQVRNLQRAVQSLARAASATSGR
jgi:hypothetical protein